MFTRKITDDDHFMELSASAQALYLHLSMSADDDGFCNQVSVAMFKAHASVQDLGALLEKRYIYQFDNGVIVVKHWRMANALRKDRYTPTVFQEELSHLQIKENGSYTMVADWFLFYERRKCKWFYPIASIAFPLTYITFVYIQAAIMGFDTTVMIPGSTTPLIYPYFFVNLETQGIGGVIKWIFILLAAFIAVGYLFFGLDRLGKKKAVKSK